MIVATIGLLPVLIAVNAPILPTPLAANPIPAVLVVQVYKQPLAGKLIGMVVEPLTTVWFCATALHIGRIINRKRLK